MTTKRTIQRFFFVAATAFLWAGLAVVILLAASANEGQVRFGETPVPGAAVQATRGAVMERAVTDADGRYALPGVMDGAWIIRVSAPGFETAEQEVTVSPDAAPLQWNLKMLPLDGLQRSISSTGFPKVATMPNLQPTPSDEAADRLLINGTVNNAASTPFGLPPAVGNNRAGRRSPYNGNIAYTGGNALFDARSFSLTGQDTPKPAYNSLQTAVTLGGPFQIPGLFRNGTFLISYVRTQSRNASLKTAQFSSLRERFGDLSGAPGPIVDPVTGDPFQGNVIPSNRISPQAQALLALYPLPNFTASSHYNYQVPIIGVTHGDNIQGGLDNITLNAANRLSGNLGYQSTRSDDPDLFGFTDAARASQLNAAVTWNRRIMRAVAVIRYQLSRTVTSKRPYFANRIDVSGNAGISGNDRDPRNWGPPALNFAGGVTRLSSGTYLSDRNLSHTVSYSSSLLRGRHSFTYGADYRRQQFNLFSQQDPRGSFTFTGAATGNDFADFLLGIPTASAIAYGNADKYFRQWFGNAFVSDDWRVRPSITLTLGVRWEYESPIVEKYGRLVNLDIAPDFASATAVIASPLEALIRPDKAGAQPRLGLAWRPRATSSLIVRAGYGLYRETSVYRAIADQMAQQAPLSRSLSVQNTPANPLTLSAGFRQSLTATAATFAIDPHFRVGSAHNWNISIQQDLPAALQLSVTYLGVKGIRLAQRILPNTYPSGAGNTCGGCPTGFIYLSSTGSSNRHGGTLELRRRQRNGFQASVKYTYAKAIDNTGLGANAIAQDWLDRGAERALSNFDQRHLLAVESQYTMGSFTRVEGLWAGWRGTLLREWTLTTQLSAGSGLPLTPVILVPVRGTGITGTLRPNVTGAPLYVNQGGGFLNPAAFTTPDSGQWGNAGRNSITGPSQFSLNASLTRTFRINDRINMDLRVEATNILNHVTFPDWNTTVTSAQFGAPTRANPMRSLQPSLRIRF